MMKRTGTLFLEWGNPLKPSLMLKADNGHAYPILDGDKLTVFDKHEISSELWKGTVSLVKNTFSFTVFFDAFRKDFYNGEIDMISNIDARQVCRYFSESFPAELLTAGEYNPHLD